VQVESIDCGDQDIDIGFGSPSAKRKSRPKKDFDFSDIKGKDDSSRNLMVDSAIGKYEDNQKPRNILQLKL
jgi:hypothetical protein